MSKETKILLVSAIGATALFFFTGCAGKRTPAPQLGGIARTADATGEAVSSATASSEEVKKFHGSSVQLVDRLDAQVKALLK
jgi:hypothetical protein